MFANRFFNFFALPRKLKFVKIRFVFMLESTGRLIMLKHTSLSAGGTKKDAKNVSVCGNCILSDSLIFLNEYTEMKNISYRAK